MAKYIVEFRGDVEIMANSKEGAFKILEKKLSEVDFFNVDTIFEKTDMESEN